MENLGAKITEERKALGLTLEEFSALVKPQIQKGYCWVYILKGSCIFERDGVAHRLKKGDSFYYDAERPHHLKLLSNLESMRR